MFRSVAVAVATLFIVGGCSHPEPLSLQSRAHAFGELLDPRNECQALKARTDDGSVADEPALRRLYEDSKKTGCLHRNA